jgi:hypothetical protein
VSIECDNHDTSVSLRQLVFQLLEKNHSYSPLDICNNLHIDHKKHGAYVRYLKAAWKRDYKNRPALKCLKFHRARGWGYALKDFKKGEFGSREFALLLSAGWRRTKAKNRMLIFKDQLGRLEWFETGRINVWLNKPASKGKLKQLLALGFFRSGVVQEIGIFDVWADSFRFKGAHATLDLGEPLPYSKVDFLQESLGVTVKTGDLSHPSCLEIEYTYPDWAERNERLLELNKRALEQNGKALEQNSQVIGNFMDQIKDLSQPRRLDPASDKKMIS